jgi:hypothetical protein
VRDVSAQVRRKWGSAVLQKFTTEGPRCWLAGSRVPDLRAYHVVKESIVLRDKIANLDCHLLELGDLREQGQRMGCTKRRVCVVALWWLDTVRPRGAWVARSAGLAGVGAPCCGAG